MGSGSLDLIFLLEMRFLFFIEPTSEQLFAEGSEGSTATKVHPLPVFKGSNVLSQPPQFGFP